MFFRPKGYDVMTNNDQRLMCMRGMNYQGISVICQGDTTTTGGRVLEGAPENYAYEGIPIALMGHKVWCPGCGVRGVVRQG